MAFFRKTKEVMSAIKRIPRLRAMYKSLCPECKEIIKNKLKEGSNDVNTIIEQFCKDCKDLQE